MPKILIVDDQPTIRNMLSDAFTTKGYEVTALSDGKSGLDEALKGGYDAIMLDLKMPEMDGLHVLDKLKKSQEANGPVIVFSSVAYPFAEPEAIRRGAAGFINKDEVTPDQIIETVTSLIAQHEKGS